MTFKDKIITLPLLAIVIANRIRSAHFHTTD